MISQVNAANVKTAYQNSETVSKVEKKSVEKQGDISKVETLKNAIESGEYKVNLDQLSQIIADELL